MSTDDIFQARTPFALKEGRVLAPEDVESGLGCGCVCPGCGAPLMAKKGSERAWHFAHHKVIATLSCVESAIHAAAKQVLLDTNWLRVPGKSIQVWGYIKSGVAHSMTEVLAASRSVRFDYCREEVWETNIRPDVVGYRGDRRILVEMFFTHQVDETKRQKLEQLCLPALEIDLSKLAQDCGFAEVRQRVLEDIQHKEWLFYPQEKEALAALRDRLTVEITRLNLDYDELQELRQKAEERQKAKQQEIEAIKRRQDAARAEGQKHEIARILREREQYRALPLIEKERRLRESLGISGAWPYYLNRTSDQVSAVQALPRIWQTGLFSEFIFGKKTGTEKPKLVVIKLLGWITRQYGVVDSRNADALVALKQFLGYLRGCGFLEKAPYNPDEDEYYKVVHDKLAPPERPKDRDTHRNPSGRLSPQSSNPPLSTIVKPHWIWRASWPSKEKVLESANLLLAASQHRDTLLRDLETLCPQGRPNEPLVFAILLETQRVPRKITLDLLVELGLALKSSRTI